MIRKAERKDISAVAEIYEQIHAQKNDIGWLPQIYPVQATAEAALGREDLYVYEEGGAVLAAAIINQIQGDVYSQCDWRFQAMDSSVMVLHTLVVKPGSGSKGLGRKMIEYYEKVAAEQGCEVLRIDTGEMNHRARNIYRKAGYLECGIFPCVFNGIPDFPLVLLEKKI